jgi:hypothetical protein
MSESTPPFAPIVVLVFLGAVLLLGSSALVLFYGAVRRSSFFAIIGAGATVTIAVGYLLVLSGVSAASSEIVLPPGGWKYFCEIDCHIGYSVAGAHTAAAIGPEMQQVFAGGRFVVVRLKTWFDERTISARRGNGPLTPNRRKLQLVDDLRRSFAPSPEGQQALERVGGASPPLTQPLRPGESYTTDFVFDVPKDARGLRLLITEDDPETLLVIGHENSLLHKKIYLGLPQALSTSISVIGALPLQAAER